MTSSAPRSWTSSAFFCSSHPSRARPLPWQSDRERPTPPDAPTISTRWLYSSRPASRKPWSAAIAEAVIAAASVQSNAAGLPNQLVPCLASSAAVPGPRRTPRHRPRTSVTPMPTASTVPARSRPGTPYVGRLSPVAVRTSSVPRSRRRHRCARPRPGRGRAPAIADGRWLDVSPLERFDRAVAVVDDGLHWCGLPVFVHLRMSCV